jgi:AraC-like DNA-binding protein
MTRDEKIARAIELRARGAAWTQRRIADELGVSQQTVCRWFNAEYAERCLQSGRAYKDAHRAELLAADMRRYYQTQCIHCSQVTGTIDDVGDPCCPACKRRLANHPASALCAACGDPMPTVSVDGICGFCREEQQLQEAA